jgi:hypothetical protein
MNEILHANIFFLIASIATVCFCILVSIILFQVIKVLKLVRSILERVEAGSEVLASDLAHIRMFFSEGGFLMRLMGMFGGGKTKNTRHKKPVRDEEEEYT